MTPSSYPQQRILYRFARLEFAMVARRLGKDAVRSGLAPLRCLTFVRRALGLPANTRKRGDNPLVGLQLLDSPHAECWPAPSPVQDSATPTTFTTARCFVSEATGVRQFKSARVWGYAAGCVMDSEDRMVAELSRDPWGAERHAVYQRMSLPGITELPGRTLMLSTPEAVGNFHHWMLDFVPRVRLLQRAGFDLGSFDTILLNHQNLRFQRESMDLLGIPLDRIRGHSAHDHFRCEELVCPSYNQDNTAITRRQIGAVRELLLPHAGPPSSAHRVYLSRGDASLRRVVNEDAVIARMRAAGVAVVRPSELTLREQIALAKGASVILGPSGANLVSMIFANPGCEVIEFMHPGWIMPYTWGMAAGAGHRLRYFVPPTPTSAAGHDLLAHRFSDYEIPLDAVDRVLDSLGRGVTTEGKSEPE